MRLFSLGNDSDRSWQWYGENDPYYGVLSGEQFRRVNLSRDNLAAFFETGIAHVDRVMDIVVRHMGVIETRSCLDFGCGVGRLVVPLARKFGRVSGIDISDAMISEAKRNCQESGVSNVAFYRDIASAPGSYDFVHSYIVIQHIPVGRGLAIINQLIDRLAPDGVAFIHVTIGRNAGWLRDVATFLRKNVPLLHLALNVVGGRKPWNAYMQMNRYPLNALMAYLYSRGILNVWCEIENHRGNYGVCLVFRAPRPVVAHETTPI